MKLRFDSEAFSIGTDSPKMIKKSAVNKAVEK